MTIDFIDSRTDASDSGHLVSLSPFSSIMNVRWRRGDSGNTTIDATPLPSWHSLISSDLFRELTRRPIDQAAIHAVSWIRTLPAWVSKKPLISANDDGTFSVEWRTDTSVLHVMFEGHHAEAYFNDGADEWETDIEAATDKLVGALRSLS